MHGLIKSKSKHPGLEMAMREYLQWLGKFDRHCSRC